MKWAITLKSYLWANHRAVELIGWHESYTHYNDARAYAANILHAITAEHGDLRASSPLF